MSEERKQRPEQQIIRANPVSRRGFLNAAALLAGSAAIACSTDKVVGVLSPGGLRASEGNGNNPSEGDDGSSKFDHVIVVMQENRSFDHLLGWAPRADGRQAGLKYDDNLGVSHHTYPLAPDFQGCGRNDPDHSYEGARVQYDNGACDGFMRGDNDIFAIGYYGRRDLDFFVAATSTAPWCWTARTSPFRLSTSAQGREPGHQRSAVAPATGPRTQRRTSTHEE